MAQQLLRNRLALTLMMLMVGIAIGGLLPHTPIHAMATDRVDTFLAATGPLDGDLEAVYLFDCLTGELMAAALQKPPPFRFNCVWKYNNVLQDLNVDLSKNPKFLMVPGMADLRGGPASTYLGYSVVYIIELSSGKMAAYAVPFNRSQWNSRRPMGGTLVRIGILPFRNAPIPRPGSKSTGARPR